MSEQIYDEEAIAMVQANGYDLNKMDNSLKKTQNILLKMISKNFTTKHTKQHEKGEDR